jgi:hypothetical protein
MFTWRTTIFNIQKSYILPIQGISEEFRRVRKIAKRGFYLNVCLSVCLSDCLSVGLYAWKKSVPTAKILIKLGIWRFIENLLT